jgi:hypothetical protein
VEEVEDFSRHVDPSIPDQIRLKPQKAVNGEIRAEMGIKVKTAIQEHIYSRISIQIMVNLANVIILLYTVYL